MLSKPTYEDLEEEVLQLKHELGLRVDMVKTAKLRRVLRVTPGEAKIILALYEAKGPLRYDVLNRLCSRYPTTDVDGAGTATRVTSIRRVLDYDFIDTHRGFGYALSYVGREKVKAALDG